MSPHARGATRQKIFRIALFVMAFVTFALIATACIFDEGTYKGGGRIGQAATAQQEKVGTSSSSSSSSSGTTGEDDGAILRDAGLGGDG